jgi:hypothetical protein
LVKDVEACITGVFVGQFHGVAELNDGNSSFGDRPHQVGVSKFRVAIIRGALLKCG